MKRIIKKLNAYFLYTIMFILLSIIVFLSFIKNGRSFIWSNNSLTNISPQLYTFSILIGLFVSGLSYITYCVHNKKGKYAILVGSLLYTFSGYFLYEAIRNPFAIFPAIVLPLMFLSIDRIFKKDRYILFIIVSAILAISAVFNTYYLYSVTIFTIIYSIIKCLNEYKSKGKKAVIIKMFKTLLCYILGISITSIALLHSVNLFKHTSIKFDFGFTYYDFEYLVKSLFMSSSTAFWSKFYILPIYLTLLPVAVLNFKKSKENKTFLITLATLTVLFIIPYTSYVLNGFVFEPNKWSFIFNFVLAYLVTINIREDLIYSPREFKFIKKMLIVYLVLWFFLRSKVGTFALTSFIFAFLYLIIILARSLDYKELKENQQFEYAKNLKGHKSSIIKFKVKAVLLIALSLNIAFFSWNLFTREKYAREFAKFGEISKISQYSSFNNSKDISFEFSGKNKDKIINENTLKIAKKYKSFELEINDTISQKYDIYLIINNLKYLKNNQYSVTVKYNDISQKQIIRDKVKTPEYIKNEALVFNLGHFNIENNPVKITFSSTGNYTFDNIKLIAAKK